MLTITIVSSAIALIAGIVAWRSIRRERRRAEARVALLSTLMDEAASVEDAVDWPWEADVLPSSALIPDAPESFFHRRPLLSAGSGLGLVLTIVVVVAMTSDYFPARRAASIESPQETPETTPRRVESFDPPRDIASSLELLSVSSARDGSTLAVTGLVRNPSDEVLKAMTALVAAVDAEGRTLATGTAAIDAISPGEKSLFVVTISRVDGAARYRVSFQDASGVIRHLDRRAPTSRAS